MAGYAYLQLHQGDDYNATVVVSGDPSIPPSSLLSGYTAKAQIRQGTADQAPVLVSMNASVSSPNVILNIPAAQTATLSGTYRWDLQLISSSGIVTTILSGPANVQAEITR